MSEQVLLDKEQTQTETPSKQGMEKYFFRASAADFKKIPGSPIAYWTTAKTLSLFKPKDTLRNYDIHPATGLQTGDNNSFIRYWFEISNKQREYKWLSLNNGGDARKWYGNFISCINWENNGTAIKSHKSSVIRNVQYYFKKGATWSRISSEFFAIRYLPEGFIFDQAGDSFFTKNEHDIFLMIGFLNSPIGFSIMKIICPTLNATAGSLELFPYPDSDKIIRSEIKTITITLINNAKTDWDSYETSWDFTTLPLLQAEHHQPTIAKTYEHLRAHWLDNTLEMQRLEEENNRIFIDAYGLQDELTPEVPLKAITLTCNPHYRYGGEKTDEELEALLRADTIREFISYAAGCIFGRYSLDKPGLVLANQGESIEDYLAQVPEPSFMPDADNVIPLLNDDWFSDDITERFRQFVRVTFGDVYYDENIAFIEEALGRDIRNYFIRDFYKDHVKTYKRRPIYWLFSSPKGSFNALIYMHRYHPDTVSIVLNDYLREFRIKLVARKEHLESVGISANASQRDKTRALKDIGDLNKMIAEVDDYERDILYPLATQQIEIDLDDGVKVNYPKFGKALNKAPRL